MIVEAVGVVKVEANRADAYRSYYTKVLLDKSDVEKFSKNVFLDLHFDVSCHAELFAAIPISMA